MKAKVILTTLTVVLGYALIAAGFIIFGKSLPDNVRVLDLIVTWLVFSQYVAFACVPWISLRRRDKRGSASLGILIIVANTYTVLALIIMLAGIVYDLVFKYQLLAQGAVLFIALVGVAAAMHASDKASAVYGRQQRRLSGLDRMRTAATQLSDRADLADSLSEADRALLHELCDSLRYLTPSAAPEAASIEDSFVREAAVLDGMIAAGDSESVSSQLRMMRLLIDRRRRF